MNRPKYIAVDFDDTLFIRKSWKNMIGVANEKAIRLIQVLHERGWKIILWTSRNGKALDEAVQFCKDHHVHIDFVNENPEAIEWFKNHLGFKESAWSPKVFADVYLDDSAFNPDILEGLEGYTEKECVEVFEEFCEKRHRQKVEVEA